jgi:hypothetical protein
VYQLKVILDVEMFKNVLNFIKSIGFAIELRVKEKYPMNDNTNQY